ncbi:YitT family protein [Massiliimalia massiliensis]|uniref:YitT family protein n=1 Tax=Massiliimalia massiliensis TaxID=1852384 RepID=UPI0009843F5E|nr:YitT family protein [Massiliimalia massiliensis]
MTYHTKFVLKRYFFMVVGCLFYAASIDLFLVPHHIVTGGVTGAATLIAILTNVKVGITSALINIPILIVAFKMMGWKFIARCFLTTWLLGIFIDIFSFLPSLTDNLMMASFYAGICQGIGIGLFYKYAVSSGGTELLARILMRLFKHFSLGTMLGILDGLIVIIGCVVLKNPENTLCALIVILVSSKVSDIVIGGRNNTKLCYIITECSEEISARLLSCSERGITYIPGKGMYQKKEKGILMTVVKNKQVAALKEEVHQIDPQAFVIIGNASEVCGNGFHSFTEQA